MPSGAPAPDQEEQPFIAPPRSDYDYRPLDLAPPGQRRRRQFVAAAIGGLTVLLLVTIGILAFLLFRDEDPDDQPENDIVAAQTELNNAQATINAQSTILANAAATGTATVEAAAEAGGDASSGDATAGQETPEAGTNEDDATNTGTSSNNGNSTIVSGEVSGAGNPTATTGDASSGESGAGPTIADLQAMLPDAGVIPAELDATQDSNLDLPTVVDALGGSRTAEQNLERWGWSGNVGRSYSASDPTLLAAGELDFFSVSIHGFADDASAAEALTYFSDVLVSIDGTYQDMDTGPIGDMARLLVSTDESGGQNVALYIQQGNVLYRIGGHSPAGGDGPGDVRTLAQAILPAQE